MAHFVIEPIYTTTFEFNDNSTAPDLALPFDLEHF